MNLLISFILMWAISMSLVHSEWEIPEELTVPDWILCLQGGFSPISGYRLSSDKEALRHTILERFLASTSISHVEHYKPLKTFATIGGCTETAGWTEVFHCGERANNISDRSLKTRYELQRARLYCPSEVTCPWEVVYSLFVSDDDTPRYSPQAILTSAAVNVFAFALLYALLNSRNFPHCL